MIVEPTAAIWAAQYLTTADFFRDAHAIVFSAIAALVEERTAVDFVTLHEYLARRHEIEEVGGPAYLSGLADGVPRGTNIRYYGGLLTDYRIRRELIATSDAIVAEVVAGDQKAPAIIDLMDAALLRIERPHGDQDLVPESDRMDVLFKDLERRVDLKGRLSGLSTGLTVWDRMTGGLQRGDLTIVAARPSVGKTALMGNVALGCARTWKANGINDFVAFFSLEMSRLQVEYRLLSSMTNVMLFRILHGHLTEPELDRLGPALSELGNLPLAIDDTANLTVEAVRAKCRRLRATKGLGLVILDYVQLVSGSGVGKRDAGNRNAELTHISRRMKMLAKELDVPVVILSQLSRAPEGREDKRPRMSDLRESGALEQDADNVVMLHRPNPFDDGPGGLGELIIEKQRNGPTGILPVYFEKEFVTFRDARPEDRPATPEPSPEPPKIARLRPKRGTPQPHFMDFE